MAYVYKIYRFIYFSKKPKVRFIVFARTRETADKIIAFENTDNIYILKPKRFFGVEEVELGIPPYEFEQEQLESAERDLERRRQQLAKDPSLRKWLAKQE